ncbi:MAG: T9SS type A sorting domain-containing protein, partial [Candidatus Desantisbacteria bacterium]
SGNYTITLSDFNQGGGGRNSSQYKIDDAIGQGMTGDMKSSSYNLSVGFLILLPQLGTSTAPLFAVNNNSVKVYPNPYKKNDANFGGDIIWFNQVSQGAVIKIYNIAGELIKEIEVRDNPQKWNISQEKIASGVYIYCVTGGSGGKSVGKIGIVK